MNAVRIDRIALTLAGLPEVQAAQVEQSIGAAVTQSVGDAIARRFARAGASPMVAAFEHVDLGTLTVADARDARAIVDAIAARLADWIEGAVDSAPGSAAPDEDV